MSSALLTLSTDKHSQSYLEDRSLQFLLACSGFAFLKLGLSRLRPQSPCQYLIHF